VSEASVVFTLSDGRCVKISALYMTPERANELLVVNKGNRSVRKQLVTDMADDIRNGEWEFNGDTIKVAQAASDYTRTQIREDSFAMKILPPQKATDDRLDRDLDERLRIAKHEFRKGPCEEGFSNAGRASEEDVLFGILEWRRVGFTRGHDAGIVVVVADRDTEDLLSLVLPNDKSVEVLFDIFRREVKIQDRLRNRVWILNRRHRLAW
jgi:hypothetical protein